VAEKIRWNVFASGLDVDLAKTGQAANTSFRNSQISLAKPADQASGGQGWMA
jgi:hypothetical protein